MKRYLVIQLARFGDLLQTKRLLATLCARPEASVHLCLDRSLAPLARLVHPEAVLHPITAHGTGLDAAEAACALLTDNRAAFAELQAARFDEVYNLNFSGLNFRLAALFDPDSVRGYAWKDGQELIGPWPAMAMRWSEKRRIGLNLVDFWGAYCPDAIAPETVNPTATPHGGGIGVVLSGRESRRSLPVDVLAQAASTLVRSRGAKDVFLLGGPAEAPAGQAVRKRMSPAVQDLTANLAGKTDWADLVEVVSGLDLLLTPDTGTMHLAAHLGTPVMACFLSSAWCFETGPYGAGHTVLQSALPCGPCLETAPCQNGVACLRPFADPGFQRHLVTGRAEHLPEGLTAYASAFDGLGLTFAPLGGADPDVKERTAFRRFIQQYLTGNIDEICMSDHELGRQLYREADWMARPGEQRKEQP
ncbi:glycosyltransferase family 9 protein [Pseudodesulfovibrio sp.]|uniref:glycosyltransferase family 9 protein n=1 Tax=Pseudodesulfovibrio sp. TaxID=2035812 RepID=UPI0026088648|nr:glycosyltransferase family 9 protein [Pseudodesulfovibrio sp.]MDD3312006.1 glycosyltransferase family 9 protein [Pseudodesulfovibrio sp.]